MVFERVVVVIPAHNEVDELPRCVRAVQAAARCVPIPVSIVVVLDACDDGSERLAGQFGDGVHVVDVMARNVGLARAAGFDHARAALDAGGDGSRTWYATTDADSRVDPDWLVRQTAVGADMVLGVVRVANWRHHSSAAVARYLATYRAKSRRRGAGHGHVHGANMGFRADVYWELGGFAELATGEDVDLVRRFEAADRRIERDAALSVVTSDRVEGRAPEGFAGYLRTMAERGGAT